MSDHSNSPHYCSYREISGNAAACLLIRISDATSFLSRGARSSVEQMIVPQAPECLAEQKRMARRRALVASWQAMPSQTHLPDGLSFQQAIREEWPA